MAPKSKSIFRQPGAQHFQLVHRSQRDPLIHDPEASQHVLKQFVRENDKKGRSRSELEELLNPSDLAHDAARLNIGEASLYGVYFDDTDYDYMQHLRPVGVHEDGVESTLLEAPKTKSKGKDRAPIELRDLPAEALPSTSELPRDYESQQAIPSSIAGFQPDMDPHLRQVLEALEEDAFVDDALEDDFFAELVRNGERGAHENLEFEFAEEGLGDETRLDPADGEEEKQLDEDTGWEARFAAFKKKQKAEEQRSAGLVDEEEWESDGGDTVGRMPDFSVIGGKRRRGGSDASGYSMTSSAMFRTEGLRLLDDRFEHLGKEYEENDEDIPDDSGSDSVPELITSREDFESLMDDFLDNYEIHGGKLKPSLEGTGVEKLKNLRLALGRDSRVCDRASDKSSDDNDDEIYSMLEKEDKRERWDVETVLTTHTNLENHPGLIRARENKPVPKILLNPRTGLPTVRSEPAPKMKPSAPSPEGDHRQGVHLTVTRSRDESAEDKKARKQAVKLEKQNRRVEKKTTKQQFSVAIKQQSKMLGSRDVKTRKL